MSGYMINRRDFLIFSSLGFAGAFIPCDNLTTKAFAAGNVFFRPHLRVSVSKGDVRVIDPQIGGPFKNPPDIANLSRKRGIVEVTLETKRAPVSLNGTTVNLLTYNGSHPAQTIEVEKGDRLKVLLKNSFASTDEKTILGYTKNITNLHTHGWHVSPSGNSDNIFVNVNPGKEYLYEYDTSRLEAGTLSYYHPHLHGLVAEQMWAGLAGGALIVKDETKALSDFETKVIVLKDISLDGSEPIPYTEQDYIDGKEGDIVFVNGEVNPLLHIRQGQVQRWRIVNASTARYYKLSLEGHKLYLIGTDGGLLDKPYQLSEILIIPGERVDLLVIADNKPGIYKFLSLPYNRQGNELEKITLMTVEYRSGAAKDRIPASINPEAKRINIDLTSVPRKKLYMIMAYGEGFINLKDFNVDPYVLVSKVGTHEIWDIINISPMDHPFHQHTNHASILSIQGGDNGYASLYSSIPAWKDTVNVPFCGSVTMLVPVRDFAGRSVFHCHILEHEETGMMGIWEMV